MKDSKVRIQIPISPEKKKKTLPADQQHISNEAFHETEGSAARVLEWKFPEDNRKKKPRLTSVENTDEAARESASFHKGAEVNADRDADAVITVEEAVRRVVKKAVAEGAGVPKAESDGSVKSDGERLTKVEGVIPSEGEGRRASKVVEAQTSKEESAKTINAEGMLTTEIMGTRLSKKGSSQTYIVEDIASTPLEGTRVSIEENDVRSNKVDGVLSSKIEGRPSPPEPVVRDAARPGPRSAPPGQTPRAARAFRARPSRFGRRGFAARRPAAPGRRVRLHPAVLAAAGLLALALALPLFVVAPGGDHKPAPPAPGPAPAPAPSAAPKPAAEEPTVSVYLTKTNTVETLPLESYIVGVVAAEMPAEFQLEALKAQAIAARTYIVQRLKSGDKGGVPDNKSHVTDTVTHQAYLSQEKLEQEWKAAGKEAELAKLRQAVKETRGIVMTYRGAPINASFFSTSNGYTENSEDYWKNEIPYLRSVESPWDEQISPKYKSTVKMPRAEFIKRLGLSDEAIPASAAGGNSSSLYKVISYTKGNRIQAVRVGGKKFTGREIREKLELHSSQFSWSLKDGEVEITTYGNGHGVGMSQYGAEGMAREGYKAKEILRHYYTGIEFQETAKLLSSKK